MLDTRVRPKIQPFFTSVGKPLLSVGLSANTITLISFITGVASGACVVFNQLMLACVLLWLSGACDILDGTVARLSKPSKVGAFLDLLSDRVVECAVILGFTSTYPQYYLAYIIFLISVIVHFSIFLISGNLFQNTGKKCFFYLDCLTERAEAFIGFSFMMFFPNHIFLILMIMNALIFISATNGFLRVIAYAKRIDYAERG